MFLGTQRRFGVEIEFIGVDRHELARAISAQGIDCVVEGYNHRTQSHWKIVTDASCGYEMVSPILQGESGFFDLKIVMDTMTEMCCAVNRQTGVHVHLEAVDLTALDVKNIVKRYSDNEAEIDSWFPRSRRANNNTYCRSVEIGISEIRGTDESLDAQPARATTRFLNTRFTKLNLASLDRYNTIEFRQHAGSTDYAKVSNWILFLQHFMEQSAKMKNAGGPNMNVRRSKSRVYDEVRTQIETAGGQMRHAGGQNWKVTSPDGAVHIFTIEQLDALYVGNPYRGRRVLDVNTMRDFWSVVIGTAEVIDDSLNAEIPTSVVEFFETRREALAA